MVYLIDWLMDWLFDWLLDWLIDVLTGWYVDWLFDLFIRVAGRTARRAGAETGVEVLKVITGVHKYFVKRTVSVISSEHPCNDDNVFIFNGPFNLIKNVDDTVVFLKVSLLLNIKRKCTSHFRRETANEIKQFLWNKNVDIC